MPDAERQFLTDANILIDYFSAGLEIMQLVSEHLAQIVVPDVVFQEVRNLTVEQAASFKITVVETPLAVLDAALVTSSRRLSFQDRICLGMAESNLWTCATNDKALKQECDARGIPTTWGLELMIRLVDRGVLSRRQARAIAQRIHQLNPRSITDTVFHKFLQQLR